MGQIIWSAETKQQFLDWLQPNASWAVAFNRGGRVSITHGSGEQKPLRYVVVSAGAGFILEDLPDLPLHATDPDAAESAEEFSTIQQQPEWSIWDSGLPSDRLLDIAHDAIRTQSDAAIMEEVERLAFSLSISKLCGWISDLLADPNPLAELWAIAFAFSMSQTQGMTISEKAEELGITKAALSKRVKAAQARFGLHSRGKSSAAADSYSEHLLEDRLK